MGATLDGMVEATGAVFEAKFMLPWSFSEEGAAQKYLPQLQHNMWVANSTTSVLSVITGGGKWVEIAMPADSLYQHLLFTAEKKFWRCVETSAHGGASSASIPCPSRLDSGNTREEFLRLGTAMPSHTITSLAKIEPTLVRCRSIPATAQPNDIVSAIRGYRRNALRSTGPRTEEGKRRSCLNAMRHGLTAETVVRAWRTLR